MEKYITQTTSNIQSELKDACKDYMPNGHIGICCLTKDREYAQKIVQQLDFDYKLTFIEYPDEVYPDKENAIDIIQSQEDIRLFVGIGGERIATLLAISSQQRQMEYILVANTPNMYGIGYGLGQTQIFDTYIPSVPRIVLIDGEACDKKSDYAECVAIFLGHAVELIEKEYINIMCDKFDVAKLNQEKALIDRILNDDLTDKKKVLEYMLEYCDLQREEFLSSQKIVAKLIEEISLDDKIQNSWLLGAITLIKYLKSILKVENSYLNVPVDIAGKCRNISKLTGESMSKILSYVENKKYLPEWIHIHREYRQDFLDKILSLEGKLKGIIKTAKRYMPDCGYELGEEFDSNMFIQAVYNMSPLADECSIIAIADYLGIG